MDRAQLFDALSNLSPATFERLLFALKPPGGLIPGDTAPQMNRVKALLDWAEGSSGRGIEKIFDYLEQATTNFGTYLASLVATYENWWNLYPLTEAISARQSTFTFEQSAQTEERSKEDPIKKEAVLLPQLLQGIIDHAESEPVLLVGSPGMGKSTTLLRLLAVLAKQELQNHAPRFPVLVRLKDYQLALSSPEDSSGMLALIKEALEPELTLEISEVKILLFQEKRLFLLLDGLNEIPADVVRNKLTNFRDQCKRARIPLICTTRNLGDNFGIQRRVELQPLSPKEIHRFLSECMPGQEQQVLQLLNKGNQELGKTPFVLWMLYDVSRNSCQLPESLGEAFSRFTKNYTNYKINQEGIPHHPRTLEYWSFALEYLAFKMLKSPDSQDSGLIIAERQVVNVLTQFPSENSINLIQAQVLLNNLLNYHLLQKSHKGEISFCHQLIQEYYAAEYLQQKLPEFLKDENRFKREYVNHVKWTEPIALMLALVDDEAPAIHVVKLALDVDWMLGARLAGEVKPESQARTINLIKELKIPSWLKIKLIGRSQSREVLSELIESIKNPHPNISEKAVEALIENPFTADHLPRMLELLENEADYIRDRISTILSSLDPGLLIPQVLCYLTCSDENLVFTTIKILEELEPERAVLKLLPMLKHEDYRVRKGIAQSLKTQRSPIVIEELIKLLGDPNEDVRFCAAEALAFLGSDKGEAILRNALKNADLFKVIGISKALGRLRLLTGLKITTQKKISEKLTKKQEIRDPLGKRKKMSKRLNCKDANQVQAAILDGIKSDDLYIRWLSLSTFYALEPLGAARLFPDLLKLSHLLPMENIEAALTAIEEIQGNCKFYNYEVFDNTILPGKTISLYFSYAPADAALQTQLANHLTLLERQSVITSWSSHQILPGDDHAQTIQQQLNTADIILLLISPDAIADDTCYYLETQQVMERHQAGEARVIPILLRPVDWQSAPFSQLDMLPKNHQPVTTWQNQDEAFREIAEGVRTVAMEVRKEKGGG